MTNTFFARSFYDDILFPYLTDFCRSSGIRFSKRSAVFLLAIAMQESNLTHRYQLTSKKGRAGPARGWWQFERGGGVRGVMRHKQSREMARKLCEKSRVAFNEHAIWRALEGHDPVATGFARLLAWTSPKPLPKTAAEGWQQYAIDLWRPGKPHPKTWALNWEIAHKIVHERLQ